MAAASISQLGVDLVADIETAAQEEGGDEEGQLPPNIFSVFASLTKMGLVVDVFRLNVYIRKQPCCLARKSCSA